MALIATRRRDRALRSRRVATFEPRGTGGTRSSRELERATPGAWLGAKRLVLIAAARYAGQQANSLRMGVLIMAAQLPDPEAMVGTWRRFGLVGPAHEIIGVGSQDAGGQQMMRIRALESGEEADYALLDILDDPRER